MADLAEETNRLKKGRNSFNFTEDDISEFDQFIDNSGKCYDKDIDILRDLLVVANKKARIQVDAKKLTTLEEQNKQLKSVVDELTTKLTNYKNQESELTTKLTGYENHIATLTAKLTDYETHRQQQTQEPQTTKTTIFDKGYATFDEIKKAGYGDLIRNNPARISIDGVKLKIHFWRNQYNVVK